MDVKLTAREWGKEIENKFILFFELFNDEYELRAYSKVHNNYITLFIEPIGEIDLEDEDIIISIKSALNMAARGCPYEYEYRIAK